MPLHLLGKKSWNVYNTDNIERVRRDEAAAKAAEEAEEQRMQEVDSARRLAILRGEVPPPLPEQAEDGERDEEKRKIDSRREKTDDGRSSYPSGFKKKRKRAGEDDTEFELRIANERLEPSDHTVEETRKPTSQAPITDGAGHIDLIGEVEVTPRNEKNPEAEKEKEKKKRELEDQYMMRFSNAGGKSGLDKPWYNQGAGGASERPMKDVWGNEDPKRRERDTQRIASSDPLAMMKKGASQVRQLNKDRRRFEDEQSEELRKLRKEQDREERRHRRKGRSGGRSSEGEDASRRHRSRRRHDEEREHRRDGEHSLKRRRRRDEDQSDEHRRHRRRSRSLERGHQHRHRYEP